MRKLTFQQATLVSNRAARKKAKKEKELRERAHNDWHLKAFKDDNQKDPFKNLGSFQRTIALKAPKLLDAQEYKEAIEFLTKSKMPTVRMVDTWEPKGKGRDTLFRSLCEHLFAKFKMPPFIWSAFFLDPSQFGWQNVNSSAHLTTRRILARLVIQIAAGGSLFQIIKSGKFPVQLTKKQCHSLLNSTSDMPFIYAVRREQVLTHGGSRALLEAWMKTNYGPTLNVRGVAAHLDIADIEIDANEEMFWDSVIAWLAKHPMLDLKQVGPIVDWISHRHQQDAAFSMKGRSPLAVMRAIEDWHAELGTEKRIRSSSLVEYKPSGLKPGRYPDSDPQYQDWTVTEILNNKALAEEGRELHHCVYSYATSIAQGGCSIWSLMQADVKRITIEVRGRNIVQTRGKYNRFPVREEELYIRRWANDNGLTVSGFGW